MPRLLLGEEAMILHGYPIAAVSDLVARSSNNMMSDLAGNMASPPVILALMMASVAAVEWNKDSGQQARLEEEEASQIGAAMFAFDLLARAGKRTPSQEKTNSKKIKF